MNKRNIFKLSMLYYKNNKKTFSSVVLGLVFSLSLLFVILYLLLGYSIGINKTLNNYPSVSSVKVRSNNKDIVESQLNEVKDVEFELEYQDYFISYVRRKETPSFSSPVITYYPTILIDDKDYYFDYDEVSETFSVMDYNSSLVSEQEYDYMNSMKEEFVFVGNSFFDSGNEIILNSNILKHLNLSIEEVLDRSFSFTLPQYGQDFKIENIELFRNYKIIGVFNADLYNCPSRFGSSVDAPLFWISNSSVNDLGDKIKYTKTYNTMFQFKSFSACIENVNLLSNYIDNYGDPNAIQLSETDFVHDYLDIYPVLRIVAIITIFLTVSIFVLCIMNLINNILHMAKSKKPFTAMCKAMGMTEKESLLLNFYELLIMFLKIMIIVLGITLIVCSSLTLILNYAISNSDNVYLICFQISFVAYPILIVLLVIFLFMLAILLCLPFYNIKDKEIVSILNKAL